MWIDAFEELRGRRVLVTGSSSGIGAAIALGFAECGAKVALHAASNVALAERLVDQIRDLGGDALLLQADLGAPGSGTALGEAAIAALGGIDILINNAGAALSRVSIDQFDATLTQRILQLNQYSVIETIRAVLPSFREQHRGVVINTTSIACPVWPRIVPPVETRSG